MRWLSVVADSVSSNAAAAPPRCATALPLIHVLFVFSFPKDMVRIRVILLLHTHTTYTGCRVHRILDVFPFQLMGIQCGFPSQPNPPPRGHPLDDHSAVRQADNSPPAARVPVSIGAMGA